ncbi:MAG: sigma-70 family RNA polymerase sigma factor [Bacteroidia bacterium]|nr:sigma-70 family RNA polymerase sigma factor [Bacteroidia bacterium]
MTKGNDIAIIYNNYVDDMYTYALYLGFQENDVVDAIQDVFYNLCEAQKNIDEISNIKFYLLKSLRNRLIDLSKIKNHNVSFSRIAHLETVIGETREYVENRLIEIEEEEQIKQKIKEMLDLLSPRQQEIIYLHFMEGYDYKQVAEIMDMNYDNIRKMIYKSFKLLRKKYGDSLLLLYLIHGLHSFSNNLCGN